MSKQNSGSVSTLAAFRAAMDNGASVKVALDVALARMRAGNALATEWELRSLLASAGRAAADAGPEEMVN